MSHHADRRAEVRQKNTAGHVADVRANARRLREVLDGLTDLARSGQLPTVSDMQSALALARITEFHTTRAARSMENAVRTFEESMPCR
jgi:hypothetical protein